MRNKPSHLASPPTLSVSSLKYIDDTLWACTTICNLKPKLIFSKKEKGKSNV